MQGQILEQEEGEQEERGFLGRFLQKFLELLAVFVGNPLAEAGGQEKALFERLVLQGMMVRQNLMLTDAVAKGMNPLRRGGHLRQASQEREKDRYGLLRRQIMQRMSDALIVVPAPMYDRIAFAADAVAQEIRQSCRGNAKMQAQVLGQYIAQLEKDGWKTHDLMSPLLLVLEDRHFAQQGALQEGGGAAGAQMLMVAQEESGDAQTWGYDKATPGEGASRMQQLQMQKSIEELALESPQIAQLVHAKNADAAEIRLIAVREMLRHYFEKNPKEFREIAISLLGMVPHEGDAGLLQRISYEMARVGSIAFAYRMLLQLKKKRKMDEAICMRSMAVQKGKGKRFYVCKRACGSSGMVRGMLGLLIKKGSTSI